MEDIKVQDDSDADFSAAFAEFSPVEEGGNAAATIAKTPEEIAAEAAIATAATATKTPEEIAAESAAAAPAKPDWEADINALKAQLTVERNAREMAQAEQAVQAAKETSTPVPTYTADEQGIIAKYQEDWPDVAKAESLVRRKEYQELVGYIFQQVESRYAPVLEYMEKQAPRTQYSAIVDMVPDYDTVRDKALAWVDTQPDYMKEAYQRVTSEGTPEQVADLIDRFKKDTGYVAQAAAAPTTPAPPAVAIKPVAAALPAAAQKAVAKLAVVKTGRSDQTEGVGEEDFEGSFAQYAEQEEKKSTRR
jgi:hypothetical protein